MDPPTAGPSGSNLTNDAPPGDSSFNCEDFVPATPSPVFAKTGKRRFIPLHKTTNQKAKKLRLEAAPSTGDKSNNSLPLERTLHPKKAALERLKRNREMKMKKKIQTVITDSESDDDDDDESILSFPKRPNSYAAVSDAMAQGPVRCSANVRKGKESSGSRKLTTTSPYATYVPSSSDSDSDELPNVDLGWGQNDASSAASRPGGAKLVNFLANTDSESSCASTSNNDNDNKSSAISSPQQKQNNAHHGAVKKRYLATVATREGATLSEGAQRGEGETLASASAHLRTSYNQYASAEPSGDYLKLLQEMADNYHSRDETASSSNRQRNIEVSRHATPHNNNHSYAAASSTSSLSSAQSSLGAPRRNPLRMQTSTATVVAPARTGDTPSPDSTVAPSTNNRRTSPRGFAANSSYRRYHGSDDSVQILDSSHAAEDFSPVVSRSSMRPAASSARLPHEAFTPASQFYQGSSERNGRKPRVGRSRHLAARREGAVSSTGSRLSGLTARGQGTMGRHGVAAGIAASPSPRRRGSNTTGMMSGMLDRDPVEAVQQLQDDEALARQLQEEMDREYAETLMHRNRESPGLVDVTSSEADAAPPGVNDFAPVTPRPPPPYQSPVRVPPNRRPRIGASGSRNRVENLLQDLERLDHEVNMLIRVGSMTENQWVTARQSVQHQGVEVPLAPSIPRSRRRRGGARNAGPSHDTIDPEMLQFIQHYANSPAHAGRRRGRGRARGAWYYDLPDGNDYEELLQLAESLGEVKKRGLTMAEIGVLPTKSYVKEEGKEEEECNVCMCEYQNKERLRILPCFHAFHADCIDKWIKDNATCPVCREQVKVQ